MVSPCNFKNTLFQYGLNLDLTWTEDKLMCSYLAFFAKKYASLIFVKLVFVVIRNSKITIILLL